MLPMTWGDMIITVSLGCSISKPGLQYYSVLWLLKTIIANASRCVPRSACCIACWERAISYILGSFRFAIHLLGPFRTGFCGNVFSSRFGDYYSFSSQFPVPTGCALQVSCFDWDISLPLLFLWNFVVSSNYTGTYNFPYISVIKTYNTKHYLHDACRYSTAEDISLMCGWYVNATLARYTCRAWRHVHWH